MFGMSFFHSSFGWDFRGFIIRTSAHVVQGVPIFIQNSLVSSPVCHRKLNLSRFFALQQKSCCCIELLVRQIRSFCQFMLSCFNKLLITVPIKYIIDYIPLKCLLFTVQVLHSQVHVSSAFLQIYP